MILEASVKVKISPAPYWQIVLLHLEVYLTLSFELNNIKIKKKIYKSFS